MKPQLELLLDKNKAQFIQERVVNVTEFLATRGLTLERIADIFETRIEDPQHFLLTSSIVHGLANKSSDIDTIAIVNAEISGARMATQVFEGTDHLEVISFSDRELSTALAHLTNLAQQQQPSSILSAMSSWDSNTELRQKYLERIINGVSTDGDMPYLESLPALSQVWQWLSLDKFTKSIALAILAEKAGEHRGRIGYVINALLYLMDVVLSRHGSVFSNKKWYLLRWQTMMTQRREGSPLRPLCDRIDQWTNRITEYLASPETEPAISSELVNLFYFVQSTLAIARFELSIRDSDERVVQPFLKASEMHMVPDREIALLAMGKAVNANPIIHSMETLDTLVGHDAAAILRSVRAGLLRLELTDR